MVWKLFKTRLNLNLNPKHCVDRFVKKIYIQIVRQWFITCLWNGNSMRSTVWELLYSLLYTRTNHDYTIFLTLCCRKNNNNKKCLYTIRWLFSKCKNNSTIYANNIFKFRCCGPICMKFIVRQMTNRQTYLFLDYETFYNRLPPEQILLITRPLPASCYVWPYTCWRISFIWSETDVICLFNHFYDVIIQCS